MNVKHESFMNDGAPCRGPLPGRHGAAGAPAAPAPAPAAPLPLPGRRGRRRGRRGPPPPQPLPGPLRAATGLPAAPLPPAAGKAAPGAATGRHGPAPAGACPLAAYALPCLCRAAGRLCRAAATAAPMGPEAISTGFARITVSVSVPGGLAGALATSYTPGHGGVTVGAIGGRTIGCTAQEATAMNREDIITVSNGRQSRTLKWGEFCARYLRNHGGTIKAMEAEMDANGEATWHDGVDELTVKKGDQI